VEFHDAFEMDGHLVMTTEFFEAPTLAELCRAGSLPLSRGIASIAQVLDGLEQAHELGIVHRGITAEHVHITQDGAKLSGFDLAKPASDSNLTRIGTVAGDPRYISPEQITGQPALDARSDLYSVGVLLYLTLTGKLPFDAQKDIEILAAQVRSEPLPPSNLNPTISQQLDQIVLKALKKDPNGRFASAKEFREVLAAVETTQHRAQPVVTTAVPLSPDSHRGDEPRRLFTMPLALGSLVFVIAAAVTFWFATH
jgi:serine/threonine-protein kinase